MNNLMKNFMVLMTMVALFGTTGCEAEFRAGKALDTHYDYQTMVIEAINDNNKYDENGALYCHERFESPYLEMPSYCEQFPGLECCTWQDTRENSVCEVEWCRWNNQCEWEWQEMICF